LSVLANLAWHGREGRLPGRMRRLRKRSGSTAGLKGACACLANGCRRAFAAVRDGRSCRAIRRRGVGALRRPPGCRFR